MDPGAFIGLMVFAFFVLGVVISIAGWDRYRSEKRKPGSDPGMRPTDEVFIDPTTGRRQRVWGNPATGEREYRDE